MSHATPAPGSRRATQRANTVADIKEAARALLSESGPPGISLRAIARRLDMSAPALYRYFPNLEALLVELCVDLYHELGDHMEERCSRFADDDIIGQLLAAAHAFREWSINHRSEFTLIFASQIPGGVLTSRGCLGAARDPETEPFASSLRFSRIFGAKFNQAVHSTVEERGFTLHTPPAPPLTPELHEELLFCSVAIGMDVSVDYAFRFHSFWIRLYGVVSMEVFGQLPILQHTDALFGAELSDMAAQLGISLTNPQLPQA